MLIFYRAVEEEIHKEIFRELRDSNCFFAKIRNYQIFLPRKPKKIVTRFAQSQRGCFGGEILYDRKLFNHVAG